MGEKTQCTSSLQQVIDNIYAWSLRAERAIARCADHFPPDDCGDREWMMKARLAIFNIQDLCKKAGERV